MKCLLSRTFLGTGHATKSDEFSERFQAAVDPHTPFLSITGQYCGKLLKFSAHSFEVLGIRYLICLNISYTWERTPFDVKDIWKWPSTM